MKENKLRELFIDSGDENIKLLYLSGLIGSDQNISAEEKRNNLNTLHLIEQLLAGDPAQKRLHDICVSAIKALEKEIRNQPD